MALNRLLSMAKEKMLTVLEKAPPIDLPESHPPTILFFAISDSKERANVEIATGDDFEEAWQKGVILPFLTPFKSRRFFMVY